MSQHAYLILPWTLLLRRLTASGLRCPWSKALWTDGVRALRRYLPPAEALELLGTMVDKGVRIAVPVPPMRT